MMQLPINLALDTPDDRDRELRIFLPVVIFRWGVTKRKLLASCMIHPFF